MLIPEPFYTNYNGFATATGVKIVPITTKIDNDWEIPAVEEIEKNTGIRCRKLYIVGGGAKNGFLNRLTEKTTGKQVIALPVEATALGNLKIQLDQQKNGGIRE